MHLLELLQQRHCLEGMKFAQQEANNSDSQDFEGDPTESDPGYEVKMKMFEDRKILWGCQTLAPIAPAPVW